MKYLGTIITDRKMKNDVGFVNISHDFKHELNVAKPTLIIGLKNAKLLIPNFSILEKKAQNNLFWTFYKNENMMDYTNDIQAFYNYVILNASKEIKYYYINVFKLSYSQIKKLLLILNCEKKKYVYYNTKMLYIYYDDYVMGLNVDILEWVGFKINKILKNMNQISSIKLFSSYSFLDSVSRNIIKTNSLQYLIPYFYSLLEE